MGKGDHHHLIKVDTVSIIIHHEDHHHYHAYYYDYHHHLDKIDDLKHELEHHSRVHVAPGCSDKVAGGEGGGMVTKIARMVN